MGQAKQTTPTLKSMNKSSTLTTQIRIREVAELIAKKGYSRQACIDYIEEKWGVGRTQSDKYFRAAVEYLIPGDGEEYRKNLIAKNMAILETMLQTALDRNDLQNANSIINTINKMLGVGSKQVEIKDKDAAGYDKTITISFND